MKASHTSTAVKSMQCDLKQISLQRRLLPLETSRDALFVEEYFGARRKRVYLLVLHMDRILKQRITNSQAGVGMEMKMTELLQVTV